MEEVHLQTRSRKRKLFANDVLDGVNDDGMAQMEAAVRASLAHEHKATSAILCAKDGSLSNSPDVVESKGIDK